MELPDQENKPEASPLDTERAKLRKDGYTEAEISQILIARATGGAQHSGGASGPGVLSNVLSSLVAVAAHARAAMPSFKKDVATIFDRAAPVSARAGASASLAIKTVVIAVLGFAAWQEWNQHIISATEIAAIQARKLHAEECSARIKSILDSVPMNKVTEAIDIVQRDCDPTYAERAKACDAKFQAFLNDIDHMTVSDPDSEKRMADRVTQFHSECTLTDAQRRTLAVKSASLKTEGEQTKRNLEGLSIINDTVKAEAEFKAGHYDEAFKLSQKTVAAAEAIDIKKSGKAGDLTASFLVGYAWHALFAGKFSEALAASERSIQFKPHDLVPEINRAHALMFLGRTDEAKSIYLAHKGEQVQGNSWEQVVEEDFTKLRKAGITNPMMAEIEEELGTPVQAAAAPKTVDSLPVAAPPAPPAKTMEAVTADQLTLRRGPDKTTEAIVVLNKGAQVDVISTESNGWLQVTVSDYGKSYQGYLSGKFMTQDLTASPIPAIVTEPYDLSRPAFCGSEGAPMEYVICSSTDLQDQDSAMARSYIALVARSNDPKEVRRGQKKWLTDRGQTCNIPAQGRPKGVIPASLVACVMRMDQARTHDLRMGLY